MASIEYVHRALNHLALEKGFTQKELAERTGWRPNRISELLGEVSHPRLDTLYKLLEALDSDFSELGAWIDTLKRQDRELALTLWGGLAEPSTGSLESAALRLKLLRLEIRLQDALLEIQTLIGDAEYSTGTDNPGFQV